MENGTNFVHKRTSGQVEEYKMSESVVNIREAQPEQATHTVGPVKERRPSNASLQSKQSDPSVYKMPLYENQGRSNKNKNITSWSVLSMVKFSFFKWMETITGKSFKIILVFKS
jgi:hypothetical protein